MTAKRTAIVLAVVFVVYAVLLGWRGVLLIGTGDPVAIVLGIAVLVIPVVGAYLVWRELQFGRRTEALAHELEAAGGLVLQAGCRAGGAARPGSRFASR